MHKEFILNYLVFGKVTIDTRESAKENEKGTFKCSTCRYSYDHLGVQIGSGDPDCLTLGSAFTSFYWL